MSRNFSNMLAVAAGFGMCLFSFFGTSPSSLLAMVVCGVVWLLLGRISDPKVLWRSRVLSYYYATFMALNWLWFATSSYMSPTLEHLTFRILDVGLLVLVLGYAYANYQESNQSSA